MKTKTDVIQATRVLVADDSTRESLAISAFADGYEVRSGSRRVALFASSSDAHAFCLLMNSSLDMIADLEDYEKLEAEHRMQGEMWERDLGKSQREIDKLRQENAVLKVKAEFFRQEAVHFCGVVRSALHTTTIQDPVVMMAIAAVRFPGEDTMAALKEAVSELPKDE